MTALERIEARLIAHEIALRWLVQDASVQMRQGFGKAAEAFADYSLASVLTDEQRALAEQTLQRMR